MSKSILPQTLFSILLLVLLTYAASIYMTKDKQLASKSLERVSSENPINAEDKLKQISNQLQITEKTAHKDLERQVGSQMILQQANVEEMVDLSSINTRNLERR